VHSHSKDVHACSFKDVCAFKDVPRYVHFSVPRCLFALAFQHLRVNRGGVQV
jgi:hypothetical protein